MSVNPCAVAPPLREWREVGQVMEECNGAREGHPSLASRETLEKARVCPRTCFAARAHEGRPDMR